MFCNKMTTFWYNMPNYFVNKSLLLYHGLLILCIIVYKIYVIQYIFILLHFIPLKDKKKYWQNIFVLQIQYFGIG
jgi:hypothetical protein